MKSIRNQLLLILFIVLTIAWILVTVITYLESQHEVEEVFDSQMAQSAAVLSQLTSLHLDDTIKENKLEKEFYGHRYEKKLAFQIWEDKQLVLRSANVPALPLANSPGYSDQTIGTERWRVFSLNINNKNIYVAEKHEVREELIGEITLQSLYPLTLALPVLGLLIWISLGQALKPLRKLAAEIALRSSNNLEPVAGQTNIPSEISPIISSLNQLFMQVKLAFEREKRFTSDASHELRTPLASIKIQAQVALRAEDNEQRQHALKQIVESVDRTSHLVEQMLTLARLDPDVAAEQLTDVNLSQLIQDVKSEFIKHAENKSISLTVEETDDDVIVSGHDSALAILLRNLLSNAINYSPKGSAITIKLNTEKNNIKLMVTDTGPGIPAEERSEMFSRFRRGENAQYQQGSGLGLSIVKRIAELHNADIDVFDNPSGQGTCIAIIFKK